MAGERFRQQKPGPFFGDFHHEQVVPSDHFLRQQHALVPWQNFTKKLVRVLPGQGAPGTAALRSGRAGQDVARGLSVQPLRAADGRGRQLPSAGEVVSRPGDQRTTSGPLNPDQDHEPTAGTGLTQTTEDLLAQVVALAREQGIRFGRPQVMDCVHTEADVKPKKEQQRRQGHDRPSRDGDAHCGVKGSRRVRQPDGKRRQVREYFFGYMAHFSLTAESELTPACWSHRETPPTPSSCRPWWNETWPSSASGHRHRRSGL